MSLSLIISMIAVVISAIAVYISWRTQKRLIDIEDAREKDRLIEKRRANLVARFDREPGSQGMKTLLVIENAGAGEARNVKVMLDENPMFEHPSMCLEKGKKLEEIGPTSAVRFLLFTADQLKPPHKITITWEDDSGEPGKYSTTLTL